MAEQGYKGLPVVDDDDCVIGMLTETDYLRRLKANTFLQLLLRLVADDESSLIVVMKRPCAMR